jgi:hypothetical protein
MIILEHSPCKRERDASMSRVERSESIAFAVGNASHEHEVGCTVLGLMPFERVEFHPP